jgi:hypothetical protein
MRTSLNALDSLDKWLTRSEASRLEIMCALAAELGDEYVAGDELVGARGLGEIIHRPTNYRFVAVPGGLYTMGLTKEGEDDLIRTLTAPDWKCLPDEHAPKKRSNIYMAYREYIDRAKPPKHIELQPFLFGRTHLEERGRLPLGWCTPNDEEWEYVAREGGARDWLVNPPFYDVTGTIEAALDLENTFGVKNMLSENGELVCVTRKHLMLGTETSEVRGGPSSGFEDETFETYVLHVTFSDPSLSGAVRAAMSLRGDRRR